MYEGANIIGDTRSAGAGDSVIQVLDPSTENVIGTIPDSTPEDVLAAVAAAKAAQPGWAALRPEERAELVKSGVERFTQTPDLLDLLIADTGHPRRLAELFHLQGPMLWTSQLADAAVTLLGKGLRSQEVGPVRSMVGVLTPFNAPTPLTVWKAVPALVLGNTIVAKPSPLAPFAVDRFYAALVEAGVPAGVVNLVHGGVRAAQALVGHRGVDKLTFTGSTTVGSAVMSAAAPNLTPVVLELGGKSAAIVLPDADLELSAQAVASSCFTLSGQICGALTRLLVPRDQVDAYSARLRELAEAITVGDPQDASVDNGPVISADQLANIEHLVKTALAEGAELVCGGARTTLNGKGFYFQPTVLRNVINDSTIGRTEVFGPVLSVIAYDSLDDAVALANDSEYGLVAGVFSSDVNAAESVASRLEVGTVWVNDSSVALTTAPFGGTKNSGIGRELGDVGLLEFVQPRHVYTANGLDPATRSYRLVGSRW
jgi:aldehyde dehydrogenase (NAD+)